LLAVTGRAAWGPRSERSGSRPRCPARAARHSRAGRATRPLAGVRIAVGLHVTTETAVLLRTLRAGDA